MKQIVNHNSNKGRALRQSWDILFPFLIYFVVHDLARVALIFLASFGMGFAGEGAREWLIVNQGSVNGILNALSIVIGMAAVWPMASGEWKLSGETRPDREFFLGRNKKALIAMGIFAVSIALGMNILIFITGIAKGSGRYQNIANSQYGVEFFLGLILYGVISPLAEEIVFRGLIFQRMRRYFPVTLSVITCGVLFGLYHGNIVQALYGAVLGVAITYSYQAFGKFIVPVIFHSLANLSIFILSYKQEVFDQLMDVRYGLLSLTAAAVSLYLMMKWLRTEEKNG